MEGIELSKLVDMARERYGSDAKIMANVDPGLMASPRVRIWIDGTHAAAVVADRAEPIKTIWPRLAAAYDHARAAQ